MLIVLMSRRVLTGITFMDLPAAHRRVADSPSLETMQVLCSKLSFNALADVVLF